MIRVLPLILSLTACAPSLQLDMADKRLPDERLAMVLKQEPLDANSYQPSDCERPVYLADDTDMWLTPSQFIERGAGDCEDYALCYYYAFKQQGKKPKLILTKNHAATVVDNTVYDMGRVFDKEQWVQSKRPLYVTDNQAGYLFKEQKQ